MIEFRMVHVRRPHMKHLLVRWAIQPTNYPMSDIQFVVFRSAGNDNEWEEIAVAEPGAFHYYDYDIDAGDHRLFYYIIRAASVSGKGYVDSERANLNHDPDPIAEEMIRKKELYLDQRAGVPVGVLLRKQWGSKCSTCWDNQRNMPKDPDCPDCYGTGFPGGFLQPVFTKALMNPPADAIIKAGMSYEAGQTNFEFAATPYLSIDDVIVDRVVNTRFRVTQIQITTHRMYPVAQMVQVVKLDEHSRVYTIPVKEPDFARVGRSWDGDR